jgi:hypothetical protein
MDEQKPARMGILNISLIGIIMVLCLFLVIESLFIVASGNFIPDFSPKPADKVAVIYVEGEMVTDRNPGPGYASSDSVMKELRDAQNDGNVKAIVLRINSPGGSPVAAQMRQPLRARLRRATEDADRRKSFAHATEVSSRPRDHEESTEQGARSSPQLPAVAGRIRPCHVEFVQQANFGGSEDERGDAEVESEGDEVSDGKCHRTSGDLRVEFQ